VGQIVSEALIERLADWGVDTVFGIPGDGIDGIMEGLRRHQDRIRFVLVHHEQAAAFYQQVAFAGADPWQHVAPARSPYTTGGIGLLGTRPSEELMEQVDTLFMVGTSFPYTEHLPAAGKVRVAQIEADPASAERDPIAPQYVVSLLDDLAADDAILTCDSGTIATWAARQGRSAAAASSACPATSRPWLRACRTRSACSRHSLAGRSSPMSATAASPC
jgi:thiamine pyrophosphate-dependent acetolactate synthase large subunit-like protein